MAHDVDIAIVAPELYVESVEVPLNGAREGALVLRGRLLIHNDSFFEGWVEEFRTLGYTPVLREDETADDRVALQITSAFSHAHS